MPLAAVLGDLEGSRMVNLHGQFAMMLFVAGSDDALGSLCDEMNSDWRLTAI